jgi:hypothetical protein
MRVLTPTPMPRRLAGLLPVMFLLAACHKEPEPSAAKGAASPPPPPATPVGAGAARGGDADDPAPVAVKPGQPLPMQCVDKNGNKRHCADVLVDPPAEAQVGSAGAVKLAVRALAGYHVNVFPDPKTPDVPPFPTTLEVKSPPGVDVPKPSQTLDDAVKKGEDETAFAVAFTPKDAGDKPFRATFRFGICDASTCNPQNASFAWNVAVK